MSKLQVLVIDDDPQICDYLAKDVLIPHGFAVETASSSIEGLRKAIVNEKDLIVMSLEMPGVSGLELLRELRNTDTMVPVIIMTTQDKNQITLDILRLGVFDYVYKPVESEYLLDAIENALCLPKLQNEKWGLFSRNVIQTNQRLEQSIRNLNDLYKIGKSITSLMEPSKILDRIVDAVLNVLDGEECTLLITDPQTGTVKDKLKKRRNRPSKKKPDETHDDDMMNGFQETVLSVPLQVGDMVVGILSLNKLVTGRFTSHDAQSLRMLADYAAIAIHNVQLMAQLKESQEREKQRVRQLFERYVAPSVVEQMLNEPDKVKLGGTRQAITVVFADVRGFSTFSARTSPEILVSLLNSYMSVAADAVLAEEGTLDKFMGDAVMAFFNAPMPQPDHPLRALRAAWMLRESVHHLHKRLTPENHLHFGIGVGVAQAVVGNIGTPQLMNFTAIGDGVNKVKRLQENAKGGQILIAHDTLRLVKEKVKVKLLGEILLKGQSEPEPVYEVLQV